MTSDDPRRASASTFVLSREAREILVRVSGAYGLSPSQLLEFAVREFARSLGMWTPQADEGGALRLRGMPAEDREGTSTNDEDVVMPTGDPQRARTKRVAGLEGRDWREVGLLALSGYRVGRTSDLSRRDRHAILNWVFLKDDLSDLDDPVYAAEWGKPGSRTRLKKMMGSLSTFARTARLRDDDADYSVAIRHWEEDLDYLGERFGPG